QTAPYTRQGRSAKNAPKTSAKKASDERNQQLTLYDKLQILKYHNKHPETMQDRIIEYFAMHSDELGGRLTFSQPTLSRIIRDRKKLEARTAENPTALSSKKARVVTEPEVERALYLWVRHLNIEKGELASGPMLQAKHATFEKALDIPQERWLTGKG
ncbi:hypothetical protein F5050DRAFT_1557281, partial [Lentinula boryana]